MRALGRFAFVYLLVSLSLASCGRMGPPVPPEYLAPAAVEALLVVADPTSVRLSWTSPVKDRRGRELESLQGYEVHRFDGDTELDELLLSDESIVGELRDDSTTDWVNRRDEARSKNLPSRRIVRNRDLMDFEFVDREVRTGKVYLYQVIPVSREGSLGMPSPVFRVRFAGLTSAIESFVQSEL